MRSTVGLAAALLLGCAQSEKQPDAAADVATPAPMAAASTCRRLMPALSLSEYADIVLCGNGSAPARALADAYGDVALDCGAGFDLFLAMPYGFVSQAPLGSAVWPVADGFVGAQQGAPFALFQRDGTASAQLSGAQALAGPRGVLIASVDASGIWVQPFGGGAQFAGAAPEDVSISGAGDTEGHTLILWQTHARWLAADGTPVGSAFEVAPGMQAAALADGSLALRAGAAWTGVIRFPAETVEAAPAWLASRGDFFLARGGHAMAFGDELLAADGTSCGAMHLGAPLLGVGLDGTAITAKDSTTFRIYPQLLH